ncbi:uncharacterized protein TNCV_411371 [Trichonephila clavipes]|nr:uncharacterized protein TNCV_411371 [Trichonephila clavipes]
MDPIDAFPEHLSTTVVPVTLPDKPDALEYAARQGKVGAGIIYQEPTAKRVFVLFCKDHWHKKKTWLDNFKRAVMKAKHVNEFRPNDVMWEKNIQRPVEKSRQTAQKYRQENGLHLQQHIFCQKRLYLWLANGEIRREKSSTFWTLWSRQMHSTSSCRLYLVPSIFDGDLFSFLDEFERAPMDLRMPRLNSCVKKSIGFKPIQNMDLSVNSSIGQ